MNQEYFPIVFTSKQKANNRTRHWPSCVLSLQLYRYLWMYIAMYWTSWCWKILCDHSTVLFPRSLYTLKVHYENLYKNWLVTPYWMLLQFLETWCENSERSVNSLFLLGEKSNIYAKSSSWVFIVIIETQCAKSRCSFFYCFYFCLLFGHTKYGQWSRRN